MARPRTPKIPKPPRIESVPEDFLRYSDLPQDFLNNFRKNITSSVAFVKKDGSVRTMAFRKRLLSYNELRSTDPKSEKETNILPNNNMFRGYDVNLYNKALAEYNGDSIKASAKAYRQFFLDNVLAIMSGGKVYDFREKNQIMERFGPEVYNSLSSSMINALKSDIQSAQSESGETLQENFKNMKKKINLNQFKNLVKRIIKEEKNNLTTRKTIRISESQLRNQVRTMLKEYYDEDEIDKQRGYTSLNDSTRVELPNGEELNLDFFAEMDKKNGVITDGPKWKINRAYFYTRNGQKEINIYDSKYLKLLKLADKAINDYLIRQGWYRDNLSSDDYWPERPYSSRLRENMKKMMKEYDDGYNYDPDERDDEYSGSGVRGTITIDPLPNGDVLDIKFTGGWVPSKYSPDIDWHIEEAILYTDNGEMKIDIYDPKYADILKIADENISDYLDGEGIHY
jgi:hypothetical protein